MNIAQAKSLVIAIDGPAGAGKSTIAKLVASALHYLYIDSGAMYRAITWLVLENKVDINDTTAIINLTRSATIELRPGDNGSLQVFINGQDVTGAIRSQTVNRLVSPISAIADVRHHLMLQQQKLAVKGGVVMDGRDIGTTVLPHADLKIFLTASPEVRAKRRLKDLEVLGDKTSLEQLLAEIKQRDHLDTTRAVSPLRQAQDAVVINTDNMTIDEVVARVLALCQRNFAT